MFKKNTTQKNILKIIGFQIKNIKTGLHVDQEIHNSDVVFVKSILNWEI